VRGVAAFLVGPVLVQLGMTATGSPATGNRTAIWIAGGVALLALVTASTIALAGRMRLQEPDVERWMADEGTAIDSEAVAAAVRG
jgi:hypothetical protein